MDLSPFDLVRTAEHFQTDTALSSTIINLDKDINAVVLDLYHPVIFYPTAGRFALYTQSTQNPHYIYRDGIIDVKSSVTLHHDEYTSVLRLGRFNRGLDDESCCEGLSQNQIPLNDLNLHLFNQNNNNISTSSPYNNNYPITPSSIPPSRRDIVKPPSTRYILVAIPNRPPNNPDPSKTPLNSPPPLETKSFCLQWSTDDLFYTPPYQPSNDIKQQFGSKTTTSSSSSTLLSQLIDPHTNSDPKRFPFEMYLIEAKEGVGDDIMTNNQFDIGFDHDDKIITFNEGNAPTLSNPEPNTLADGGTPSNQKTSNITDQLNTIDGGNGPIESSSILNDPAILITTTPRSKRRQPRRGTISGDIPVDNQNGKHERSVSNGAIEIPVDLTTSDNFIPNTTTNTLLNPEIQPSPYPTPQPSPQKLLTSSRPNSSHQQQQQQQATNTNLINNSVQTLKMQKDTYIYPLSQIPSVQKFPTDSILASTSTLPQSIAMSYYLNHCRFTILHAQIQKEMEIQRRIMAKLSRQNANQQHHNQEQQQLQGNQPPNTQQQIQSYNVHNQPVGIDELSNPPISQLNQPSNNINTPLNNNTNRINSTVEKELKEVKFKSILFDNRYADILKADRKVLETRQTIIWCPSIDTQPVQLYQSPQQQQQQQCAKYTTAPEEVSDALIFQGIDRFLSHDYTLHKPMSWAPPLVSNSIPPHHQPHIDVNQGQKKLDLIIKYHESGNDNVKNSKNNFKIDRSKYVSEYGKIKFDYILMSEMSFKYGNNDNKMRIPRVQSHQDDIYDESDDDDDDEDDDEDNNNENNNDGDDGCAVEDNKVHQCPEDEITTIEDIIIPNIPHLDENNTIQNQLIIPQTSIHITPPPTPQSPRQPRHRPVQLTNIASDHGVIEIQKSGTVVKQDIVDRRGVVIQTDVPLYLDPKINYDLPLKPKTDSNGNIIPEEEGGEAIPVVNEKKKRRRGKRGLGKKPGNNNNEQGDDDGDDDQNNAEDDKEDKGDGSKANEGNQNQDENKAGQDHDDDINVIRITPQPVESLEILVASSNAFDTDNNSKNHKTEANTKPTKSTQKQNKKKNDNNTTTPNPQQSMANSTMVQSTPSDSQSTIKNEQNIPNITSPSLKQKQTKSKQQTVLNPDDETKQTTNPIATSNTIPIAKEDAVVTKRETTNTKTQQLSFDTTHTNETIFTLSSTLFPAYSLQAAHSPNLTRIHQRPKAIERHCSTSNRYPQSITEPITISQPFFPLLNFSLNQQQIGSIATILPPIRYKKFGPEVNTCTDINDGVNKTNNNSPAFFSTSCTFCSPTQKKSTIPHFTPYALPNGSQDSSKLCPFHTMAKIYRFFLTGDREGLVAHSMPSALLQTSTSLLDIAMFHETGDVLGFDRNINPNQPGYGLIGSGSDGDGNGNKNNKGIKVNIKNKDKPTTVKSLQAVVTPKSTAADLLKRYVTSPILISNLMRYRIQFRPMKGSILKSHEFIQQMKHSNNPNATPFKSNPSNINHQYNDMMNTNGVNMMGNGEVPIIDRYLRLDEIESLSPTSNLCHIIRLRSQYEVSNPSMSTKGISNGYTNSVKVGKGNAVATQQHHTPSTKQHTVAQQLSLILSHALTQPLDRPHVYTIILPFLPDKTFMEWYGSVLTQLPAFLSLHLIVLDPSPQPPKNPISFNTVIDSITLNSSLNLGSLEPTTPSKLSSSQILTPTTPNTTAATSPTPSNIAPTLTLQQLYRKPVPPPLVEIFPPSQSSTQLIPYVYQNRDSKRNSVFSREPNRSQNQQGLPHLNRPQSPTGSDQPSTETSSLYHSQIESHSLEHPPSQIWSESDEMRSLYSQSIGAESNNTKVSSVLAMSSTLSAGPPSVTLSTALTGPNHHPSNTALVFQPLQQPQSQNQPNNATLSRTSGTSSHITNHTQTSTSSRQQFSLPSNNTNNLSNQTPSSTPQKNSIVNSHGNSSINQWNYGATGGAIVPAWFSISPSLITLTPCTLNSFNDKGHVTLKRAIDSSPVGWNGDLISGDNGVKNNGDCIDNNNNEDYFSPSTVIPSPSNSPSPPIANSSYIPDEISPDLMKALLPSHEVSYVYTIGETHLFHHEKIDFTEFSSSLLFLPHLNTLMNNNIITLSEPIFDYNTDHVEVIDQCYEGLKKGKSYACQTPTSLSPKPSNSNTTTPSSSLSPIVPVLTTSTSLHANDASLDDDKATIVPHHGILFTPSNIEALNESANSLDQQAFVSKRSIDPETLDQLKQTRQQRQEEEEKKNVEISTELLKLRQHIGSKQRDIAPVQWYSDSYYHELKGLPICIPFSVTNTPFYGILLPLRVSQHEIIFFVLTNKKTTRVLQTILQFNPHIKPTVMDGVIGMGNVIGSSDGEEFNFFTFCQKAFNEQSAYKHQSYLSSTTGTTANLSQHKSSKKNIEINRTQVNTPQVYHKNKISYQLHARIVSIIVLLWFKIHSLAPHVNLRTHISYSQQIQTATSPFSSSLFLSTSIPTAPSPVDQNNNGNNTSINNSSANTHPVEQPSNPTKQCKQGSKKDNKEQSTTTTPLTQNTKNEQSTSLSKSTDNQLQSSPHTAPFISTPILGTGNGNGGATGEGNNDDLFCLYTIFPDILFYLQNDFSNHFFTTTIITHLRTMSARYYYLKSRFDVIYNLPVNSLSFPLPTPRCLILNHIENNLTRAWGQGLISSSLVLQYKPTIFFNFLTLISRTLNLLIKPRTPTPSQPSPLLSIVLPVIDSSVKIRPPTEQNGSTSTSTLNSLSLVENPSTTLNQLSVPNSNNAPPITTVYGMIQDFMEVETWVCTNFLLKTASFLIENTLPESLEINSQQIIMTPPDSASRFVVDEAGFDEKNDGADGSGNDDDDDDDDDVDELDHHDNVDNDNNMKRKHKHSSSNRINNTTQTTSQSLSSSTASAVSRLTDGIEPNTVRVIPWDPILDQRRAILFYNYHLLRQSEPENSLTKPFYSSFSPDSQQHKGYNSPFPSVKRTTVKKNNPRLEEKQKEEMETKQVEAYFGIHGAYEVTNTPIAMSMPLYPNKIYTKHQWENENPPKRTITYQIPLSPLDRIQSLSRWSLPWFTIWTVWVEQIAQWGNNIGLTFASVCGKQSRSYLVSTVSTELLNWVQTNNASTNGSNPNSNNNQDNDDPDADSGDNSNSSSGDVSPSHDNNLHYNSKRYLQNEHRINHINSSKPFNPSRLTIGGSAMSPSSLKPVVPVEKKTFFVDPWQIFINQYTFTYPEGTQRPLDIRSNMNTEPLWDIFWSYRLRVELLVTYHYYNKQQKQQQLLLQQQQQQLSHQPQSNQLKSSLLATQQKHTLSNIIPDDDLGQPLKMTRRHSLSNHTPSSSPSSHLIPSSPLPFAFIPSPSPPSTPIDTLPIESDLLESEHREVDEVVADETTTLLVVDKDEKINQQDQPEPPATIDEPDDLFIELDTAKAPNITTNVDINDDNNNNNNNNDVDTDDNHGDEDYDSDHESATTCSSIGHGSGAAAKKKRARRSVRRPKRHFIQSSSQSILILKPPHLVFSSFPAAQLNQTKSFRIPTRFGANTNSGQGDGNSNNPAVDPSIPRSLSSHLSELYAYISYLSTRKNQNVNINLTYAQPDPTILYSNIQFSKTKLNSDLLKHFALQYKPLPVTTFHGLVTTSPSKSLAERGGNSNNNNNTNNSSSNGPSPSGNTNDHDGRKRGDKGRNIIPNTLTNDRNNLSTNSHHHLHHHLGANKQQHPNQDTQTLYEQAVGVVIVDFGAKPSPQQQYLNSQRNHPTNDYSAVNTDSPIEQSIINLEMNHDPADGVGEDDTLNPVFHPVLSRTPNSILTLATFLYFILAFSLLLPVLNFLLTVVEWMGIPYAQFILAPPASTFFAMFLLFFFSPKILLKSERWVENPTMFIGTVGLCFLCALLLGDYRGVEQQVQDRAFVAYQQTYQLGPYSEPLSLNGDTQQKFIPNMNSGQDYSQNSRGLGLPLVSNDDNQDNNNLNNNNRYGHDKRLEALYRASNHQVQVKQVSGDEELEWLPEHY